MNAKNNTMNDKSHILVVDDNRDFRDELKQYLARHDYRISLAENTQAARDVLKNSAIDIIILDVMMPGEDGLSLCRDIRSNSSIPVILLTAMDDETDKIIGLEIGADDYMSKPFNPRELLARIKAVLRRANSVPSQRENDENVRYRFGRWVLDIQKQELSDEDGNLTKLSTGEFVLLNTFLKRPGTVLSRDQLLDLTQGRQADVFDRSIDNQVLRLRKKIEDDPKTPTLIKTHWGGGYSLMGDVTQI